MKFERAFLYFMYWLFAVALILPSGSAFSQVLPDVAGRVLTSQDDLRNAVEGERRIQRIMQERPKIVIEGLQPEELDLAKQSDDRVIVVEEFLFEPESRILSRETLDRITAPYRGGSISLRDIYTIVAEIDKQYDELGYVARASVPSQDIAKEGGAVRIELIEGKIGKIRIKQAPSSLFHKKREFDPQTIYDSSWNCATSTGLFSSRFYNGDFVRRGIPDIQSGNLIQTEQIENALVRYNLLHDSNLQVRLEPGANPGQSDLDILLTAPPKFQGSIYADNFGRKTTGLYREGITGTIDNLTGRGDSWFFNGLMSDSPGILDGYVSGEVPISPQGWLVTGSYEYNNFSMVSGPFSVLDLEGRSHRKIIQQRYREQYLNYMNPLI